MRISGNRWLDRIAIVFINFIRGVPIIVQLFYIYFVMPDFGVSLTAMQAAIIGLGIAYSAYQAENTVAELALQGKLIAASTFKNTTVFTLVAVFYLVMCIPLILLVARLEKANSGGRR